MLGDIRKKIDNLDEKIVALLNKRAKCSQEIGRLKSKSKSSVYVPDREAKVYRRIQELNKGPLSDDSLKAIYAEIMSGSLSLEKKISVAFLGPKQTFTHQASIRKFGKSVSYVPCQNISDIFVEVENGRCDYGVAPIENSTEGAIYHTLDSFIDSNLNICSEIMLKINLDLLSKEKDLDKIKKIYSNPQVFGQCRIWLEAYLPKAELLHATSTAKSAELVSKQRGAACIASSLVAEENKLTVLAKSIQDASTNTTRFLILAKEPAKTTGKDKTSIMVSIKDKPGALQDVLDPFRLEKINLSKVESRPSKKKQWDYYFYIDFDRHMDDPKVQKVLGKIRSKSAFLKILGSYPRA